MAITNPYAYDPNVTQTRAQNQVSQPQTGLISISGGEQAALQYMLTPNSTVLLYSSDTEEMFMKATDQNGMTVTFRAFDVKEKMPKYQTNMLHDYVTQSDFKHLSDEVSGLKKFLEELTAPSSKKG